MTTETSTKIPPKILRHMVKRPALAVTPAVTAEIDLSRAPSPLPTEVFSSEIPIASASLPLAEPVVVPVLAAEPVSSPVPLIDEAPVESQAPSLPENVEEVAPVAEIPTVVIDAVKQPDVVETVVAETIPVPVVTQEPVVASTNSRLTGVRPVSIAKPRPVTVTRPSSLGGAAVKAKPIALKPYVKKTPADLARVAAPASKIEAPASLNVSPVVSAESTDSGKGPGKTSTSADPHQESPDISEADIFQVEGTARAEYAHRETGPVPVEQVLDPAPSSGTETNPDVIDSDKSSFEQAPQQESPSVQAVAEKNEPVVSANIEAADASVSDSSESWSSETTEQVLSAPVELPSPKGPPSGAPKAKGLARLKEGDATTTQVRESDKSRIARIRAAQGVTDAESSSPTKSTGVLKGSHADVSVAEEHAVVPVKRARSSPAIMNTEEDVSSLAAVQALIEKERRKMRGRLTLLSVVFLILIIGAAGGSFYMASEKAGKSAKAVESVKLQLDSARRELDALRTAKTDSTGQTDATEDRLKQSEDLLKKIESVMADVRKMADTPKEDASPNLESDIQELKGLMETLSGEVSNVKSDLMKVKQAPKKTTPPPQARTSKPIEPPEKHERTIRQVLLTCGDSTASVPWMVAIP